MILGLERRIHLERCCLDYISDRCAINHVKSLLCMENARVCSPPLLMRDIDKILKSHYKELFSTDVSSILSDEIPPVSWVIDNFISQGLFFIAGRKGIGKSWFVLQLSTAIVNGEMFLDQYSCHASDVLYCALEDTKVRLKDRLSHYEIHNPHRLHFVFIDELPRMFHGGLVLLQSWLESHPSCKLMIIDTLARFRSNTNSNRNLYQDDYDTIGHLQSFAMQNKIALIVVHHLNKSTHLNSEVDAVSGTVGVIGSADGVHLLREKDGFVNLYSMGRDIKEENAALKLNPETMHWDYIGDSRLLSQSESRKMIFQFIIDAGKPLTMTEINDGLKKKYQTTRTLVLKMVGEGLLQEENKKYSKADTLF